LHANLYAKMLTSKAEDKAKVRDWIKTTLFMDLDTPEEESGLGGNRSGDYVDPNAISFRRRSESSIARSKPSTVSTPSVHNMTALQRQKKNFLASLVKKNAEGAASGRRTRDGSAAAHIQEAEHELLALPQSSFLEEKADMRVNVLSTPRHGALPHRPPPDVFGMGALVNRMFESLTLSAVAPEPAVEQAHWSSVKDIVSGSESQALFMDENVFIFKKNCVSSAPQSLIMPYSDKLYVY